MAKKLRRHSFVLTLWEEAGPYPNAPPVWRASLEDAWTAERYGFRDLPDLICFLEQWTAPISSGPNEED